jgi:hypothetical protein
MKKVITIIIAFVVLSCFNIAVAQEKPLIIKGLYIGMDVNNARNILLQLLVKEWKIGPVGESANVLQDFRFGEEKIFGWKSPTDNFRMEPINGEYGFAIITDYDSYEGFVSAEKGTGKVIRMSFSGKITDNLFSISKINAEDFAPSFWKNYNMPEFGWIPHGWQYASPKGYTITIMTDKFLDIKQERSKPKLDEPTIKFE